jgi:ribosomal protein L3 glutamine methyltransferase
MVYPHAEFLWLDTEDSEGEVFWITASDLANLQTRDN